MNLYRPYQEAIGNPVDWGALLQKRYKVGEARQLDDGQAEDFALFMEKALAKGAPAAQAGPGSTTGPKGAKPAKVSQADLKALGAAVKKAGWTPEQAGDYMRRAFKVEQSANLSPLQCKQLVSVVSAATYAVAMNEMEGDVP
jgi:hypothetical protein